MQPYLVLDTDDYEVKKEMKSGISHFYEFSKKKSLKEEMKAVPDGSVDLLFGIGEQDVKTYIGGTVLAAKGWEFEDGRSYFGVRFQPGSCILPEELSIRDLVNKDLEIDGNLFGDHLTEKLAGSKNISERVNVFTTEYAKLRGKELADGIQKLENYLRERIYDTDGCICIRQLAEEGLTITLALSLHAPTDEKRRELMPIANKYSLSEVIPACAYYFEKTGRRLTFEYSLVGGKNDSEEDAAQLAKLVEGLNCHVNLIPVNPIKERDFVQSEKKVIENFKNKLEKYRINVTIRREMGRDIDGACGQLRKKYIDTRENLS